MHILARLRWKKYFLIIFLKNGIFDQLKFNYFIPPFFMASETKTFNTCLTKLDVSNLYVRKKLSWQLPFINCRRTLYGNWLLGIRGDMSGFSLVRSIEPMKIRHLTGNRQYKSSNVVLGNLDQWEASHVGTNVHIGNWQIHVCANWRKESAAEASTQIVFQLLHLWHRVFIIWLTFNDCLEIWMEVNT